MYEYVPFDRERVYVELVIGPESWPVMFTYHVVPVGRPDSVNVTEYVTSENVTLSETAAPLTVNEPEDGDGSYV